MNVGVLSFSSVNTYVPYYMRVFDTNIPAGSIPSLRAVFSLRGVYTHPLACVQPSGFHAPLGRRV